MERRNLEERKREKREVRDMDAAIDRHTNVLSEHMKSFCAIWNLVSDLKCIFFDIMSDMRLADRH